MAIQRNVQQQNAISKERMQRCAEQMDAGDKLFWLRALLQQNGLEPRQGALVELTEIPDQDGTFYSGVWVGPEHKFWEFSATVGANLLSFTIESFAETTSEVILTKHGRGTGNSFGQLAIELLHDRLAFVAANAKPSRGAGEA